MADTHPPPATPQPAAEGAAPAEQPPPPAGVSVAADGSQDTDRTKAGSSGISSGLRLEKVKPQRRSRNSGLVRVPRFLLRVLRHALPSSCCTRIWHSTHTFLPFP